jgi:hypothetical protein
VLAEAIAQVPKRWRRRLLVTSDGAGRQPRPDRLAAPAKPRRRPPGFRSWRPHGLPEFAG